MPDKDVEEFFAKVEAQEKKNATTNTNPSSLGILPAEMPTAHGMTEGINDNVDQTKETDKKMVTEDDKDKVPSDAKSRASKNTKDQWGKEAADKALRHYGTNLAQENPYGNLNGMSFRNTRNLSRLADAVNNKLHMGPQSTGFRTNSSFGSQKEDRSTPHQWDKIETQEMRQMRANEAVDMAMRQGMVRQQQNVNDYEMELQKKVDDVAINLSSALGLAEVQVQTAARQAVLEVNYALPARQRIQLLGSKFLSKLANETKSEALNWAYKLWNKNMALGALAFQAFSGGMLSMNDMLESQIYNSVMNDPEVAKLDPMKRYEMFLGIRNGFTFAMLGGYEDLFKKGFGSLFKPGLDGTGGN